MTAFPLLFLAMSVTSVLAEPTVHLREQFEDGGESFTPNYSLTAKPRVKDSHLFVHIVNLQKHSLPMNEWLYWLLCFVLHGWNIVVFVFVYASCIVFDPMV